MKITDEQMVDVLLSTKSIAQASEQLQCTRKTIYNRLAKPEFYNRLANERKNNMTLASSKLTTAQNDAIATLLNVLHDDNASQSCKIKSSQIILDSCLKVTQQIDILDKLHELEELINNR